MRALVNVIYLKKMRNNKNPKKTEKSFGREISINPHLTENDERKVRYNLANGKAVENAVNTLNLPLLNLFNQLFDKEQYALAMKTVTNHYFTYKYFDQIRLSRECLGILLETIAQRATDQIFLDTFVGRSLYETNSLLNSINSLNATRSNMSLKWQDEINVMLCGNTSSPHRSANTLLSGKVASFEYVCQFHNHPKAPRIALKINVSHEIIAELLKMLPIPRDEIITNAVISSYKKPLSQEEMLANAIVPPYQNNQLSL